MGIPVISETWEARQGVATSSRHDSPELHNKFQIAWATYSKNQSLNTAMTKLDSALYIVGGGGEDCGNKVSFSSHVTSIPPSWFITAGSVPGFSSVKLLFFLPYHPL